VAGGTSDKFDPICQPYNVRDFLREAWRLRRGRRFHRTAAKNQPILQMKNAAAVLSFGEWRRML